MNDRDTYDLPRELARACLDGAEIGLILVDADRLVRFVNNWVVDKSFRPRAEMLGCKLLACFPRIGDHPGAIRRRELTAHRKHQFSFPSPQPVSVSPSFALRLQKNQRSEWNR